MDSARAQASLEIPVSSTTSGRPSTRGAMKLSLDPLAVKRTVELPVVIRVAPSRLTSPAGPSITRSRESIFMHTPAYAWSCRRMRWTRSDCCARHPLRRTGALPGAKAALSRDLPPRRVSRPEYAIPLAKAKRFAEGKPSRRHLRRAVFPGPWQAADKLQRETGVDVELIDLRTLSRTTGDDCRVGSQDQQGHRRARRQLSWAYARRSRPDRRGTVRLPRRPVRGWPPWTPFVAYQPLLEDAKSSPAGGSVPGNAGLAKY